MNLYNIDYDYLKELLDVSGITNKKLAQLLQVSESTVCRWFNQKTEISSYHFVNILYLLNIYDYRVVLKDFR